MAGLRKDVELIFRGEDRASPTIQKVRKSVGDLSNAINDQIRLAEKGEGSVDELAKAYRELKKSQGDVGEIVKIAAAYENLTSKLADQTRKVDEARQKEAQLTAQVEGALSPTKRLVDSRDSAARKLQAAIAQEERYKTELLQLGAALDAAGGDSRDFAATQDRIKQAALETARALRDAGAAMDAFKGKQATGRANIAAQEEATAFNQMAAGSGLPQAQIAFISKLENRLDALNAAIREDQASMAALNTELRDRAASDAAGRIAGMKIAMDEAEQSAARLKATSGFRQMAQEIEAGARDISRFGAQTDTAAASGQRFAAAIQAILNPTQALAGNLQSVNQILDQADAAFEGPKRRMSEYNEQLNNLQAAQAGLTSIAGNIDAFRQQEAAVAGARGEMERAQADVLRLATAMKQAEQPTEAMARDLRQAEGALETTGAAFQKEITKLKQYEAALTSAGVDVRNLDAAQDQLTASANRLAAAQSKINSKVRGKGALMGLNPNEIANLGFQVNDIIVSLISGQKPLMVFAQQGAQIGQIIPGAFSAILKFAGPLAGLAAVVITFASAMGKAADESRRLQMGQGIVTQMGDGVGATAEQFATLAGELENAGIKADDVRGKLVQLAADGLNVGQMQAYVDTAKAVAEVTGVDMADALAQVREHFQGGMEDIIALDAETNAYTDTELDLIQSLFDQGRADEARTLALQIYQGKQEEIANSQRGPWKVATDQLSQAWQGFLGWLNDTQPMRNARQNLDDLARGAAFTAALINNIAHGKGLDVAGAAKAAMGIGLPKAKAAPADPNRRTAAGRTQARADAEALAAVKATTRAERAALEVSRARNDAADKHLSTVETAEHVAARLAVFNAQEDKKEADRAAKASKRATAAGRKRDAAARRSAKAAETEAKRIASAEEALQRQLEQLDAKVAKGSTESLKIKLSAVDSEYAKLFRSIDEYSQKTGGKGLIGGLTIEQAKEHVRLQQQRLKENIQLEDSEKRISDLEKERKERLDAIADKVARGIITPEQGLNESNAVIDEIAGKISQMAQDALTFAIGLRSATPSPALEAFIAKMQTAIQNNSGGQNVRAKNDLRMDAIDGAQGNLNKVIEQRNSLIETENALVALGLRSYSDAQKNIQGFYSNTSGMIQDQINKVKALAATFANSADPAMRLYYQTLMANLKNVEIQAQGSNASFVSLKGSIDNILTTNIVGFIDEVARAFADLASGQGGVMGFLEAVGRAFLTMLANIMQTVATLIIEALILDAVDKMTGGILKPLLMLTAKAVPFHHEGGIAGSDSGFTRNVNPLIFAGAPRYHSGGIAGLEPNETAAVLKKGEEVLTESDPRHRANGGLSPQGGSGAPTGIRQVLAIGDDEIAGAMSGAAGEKTVLTHIRRNKTTIRQELGV